MRKYIIGGTFIFYIILEYVRSRKYNMFCFFYIVPFCKVLIFSFYQYNPLHLNLIFLQKYFLDRLKCARIFANLKLNLNCNAVRLLSQVYVILTGITSTF